MDGPSAKSEFSTSPVKGEFRANSAKLNNFLFLYNLPQIEIVIFLSESKIHITSL